MLVCKESLGKKPKKHEEEFEEAYRKLLLMERGLIEANVVCIFAISYSVTKYHLPRQNREVSNIIQNVKIDNKSRREKRKS